MNDFDAQFSRLQEACETLSYEKNSIHFDRFHFAFHEMVSGDTLYFIDFFLVEKKVNLIHKLRLSVETKGYNCGLHFAFYNPFIKNQSIIRVSYLHKEIDMNHFLIPLLKKHADVLRQHDFPLQEFFQHL